MAWDDVHTAIAAKGRASNPSLDGALLSRSVVVMEWVLPDGRKKLFHVTMNDGGTQLHPWEASGLLLNVLGQLIEQDRRKDGA